MNNHSMNCKRSENNNNDDDEIVVGVTLPYQQQLHQPPPQFQQHFTTYQANSFPFQHQQHWLPPQIIYYSNQQPLANQPPPQSLQHVAYSFPLQHQQHQLPPHIQPNRVNYLNQQCSFQIKNNWQRHALRHAQEEYETINVDQKPYWMPSDLSPELKKMHDEQRNKNKQLIAVGEKQLVLKNHPKRLIKQCTTGGLEGYQLNDTESNFNNKVQRDMGQENRRELKKKRRNVKHIVGVKIRNDRDEIIPQMKHVGEQLPPAMNPLMDAHKKQLNTNLYTNVPIEKKTSESLLSLLLHDHKIPGHKWMSLFSCSADIYDEKFKNNSNLLKSSFEKLNHGDKDSAYTDHCRTQYVIDDGKDDIAKAIRDNKEYKRIRNHLEESLKMATGKKNYHISKLILIRTVKDRKKRLKKSKWKVHRQQFHTDWVPKELAESVINTMESKNNDWVPKELAESAINTMESKNKQDESERFFFILPLQVKQKILTRSPPPLPANESEHRLKLDSMFVGRHDLEHAGTDDPGYRIHGVYVVDTEKEMNSNEEVTNFCDDPEYPE